MSGAPVLETVMMCLFCGAIVKIEDAAEQKHTCRPLGAQGPYLPPQWRPWR